MFKSFWKSIFNFTKIKILHPLGSSPSISIFLRKIAELNFIRQKRIIKKYFNNEDHVLDIGCGTGEFSGFFSKDKYTGIDIDEKGINYAKEHCDKNFKIEDATKMTFVDSSFDNVLIVGVLHHLSEEDCKKVFREIKRVLVSGGKCLIMESTLCAHPLVKIMQSVDQGAYIRSFDKWHYMVKENFSIEEEFTFKNGITFYSAFLLKTDK